MSLQIRAHLSIMLFFLSLCLWGSIDARPARRNESAITYSDLTGMRFGDRLVTYLHARWAAYKLDLPFLYRTFTFSDYFMLHDTDEHYSERVSMQFPARITYSSWKDFEKRNLKATLFEIPYFPECLIDLRNDVRRNMYYEVDWKDPGFKALIKHLFTLTKDIDLPAFPKDRVVLGVHARKGGGFDSKKEFKAYPLKFPSDDFYIEQIKVVDDMLGNQPLYVHLFTDDQFPEKLAEKYSRAVDRPHIEFGFRHSGNRYDRNIVEDFIAMSRCDCMIRPESHLSLIASKLTEYKIQIYPLDYVRDGKDNRITKVMVETAD